MALANIAEWNQFNQSSPYGAACGAADNPEENPAACGAGGNK